MPDCAQERKIEISGLAWLFEAARRGYNKNAGDELQST
jgi:hypothetical protein